MKDDFSWLNDNPYESDTNKQKVNDIHYLRAKLHEMGYHTELTDIPYSLNVYIFEKKLNVYKSKRRILYIKVTERNITNHENIVYLYQRNNKPIKKGHTDTSVIDKICRELTKHENNSLDLKIYWKVKTSMKKEVRLYKDGKYTARKSVLED